MNEKTLKNKPLVEAIVEIKWDLQSPSPNILIDPHYKILIGRLYDRIQSSYPYHEQLPAAEMPDEISGYTVQHRFRCAEKDWPLIQIGPGILTINDTSKYIWSDFRVRAEFAVEKLYESYPRADALIFNTITLRYIDAIEFEYEKEDIFDFLKNKMKVQFILPESLFSNKIITRPAQNLNWQAAFSCQDPAGTVIIKFVRGMRNGKSCLIWETIVQSVVPNIPTMPKAFLSWLDSAHEITHDWFFKLIEGDLERKFNNE